MTLSKSSYLLSLRHPAHLWLKHHAKHKLPPINATLQSLFNTGNAFESHTNQLHPNATQLGFTNYNEYLTLPARTQSALQTTTETILQGRFEVDNLTCIVDILQRNPDNTFNLIEVKASTKAKPEHEYDLAFQVLVLEKSGLKIRDIFVVHANKEYVRGGEIDPAGLTATTEITDKVRALADVTLLQVDKAFETLSQEQMPDISPRFVNQLGLPRVGSQWMQEWLEIYKTFHPDLDKYSIYNLSYPSPEQIGQLEDKGIKLIQDIPEELALRTKQLVQIQTTRDNKRILKKEKIGAFLNTLQYPLYFFDYETFSSVIPQFDGGSPYKDYPFQYSLHVIESPGAEAKHLEYLHSENSNPMPGLIEQLKLDIGETGTVLAWSMSYEKGCNDRMAQLYPEHADFLASLNERINDLMIPFSKVMFFDKDFFGSASVKKVMPVLAPELSYKELDVGDGLLARRLWTETVLEGKHGDEGVETGDQDEAGERTKIMDDLSKYCTLDTFAMVRILEELKDLVG